MFTGTLVLGSLLFLGCSLCSRLGYLIVSLPSGFYLIFFSPWSLFLTPPLRSFTIFTVGSFLIFAKNVICIKLFFCNLCQIVTPLGVGRSIYLAMLNFLLYKLLIFCECLLSLLAGLCGLACIRISWRQGWPEWHSTEEYGCQSWWCHPGPASFGCCDTGWGNGRGAQVWLFSLVTESVLPSRNIMKVTCVNHICNFAFSSNHI